MKRTLVNVDTFCPKFRCQFGESVVRTDGISVIGDYFELNLRRFETSDETRLSLSLIFILQARHLRKWRFYVCKNE